MQSMNLTDQQGMEICENVSRLLVDQLDNEDTWTRVEQMLSTYLKDKKLNEDASNLTDNLEWSVRVRLKR